MENKFFDLAIPFELDIDALGTKLYTLGDLTEDNRKIIYKNMEENNNDISSVGVFTLAETVKKLISNETFSIRDIFSGRVWDDPLEGEYSIQVFIQPKQSLLTHSKLESVYSNNGHISYYGSTYSFMCIADTLPAKQKYFIYTSEEFENADFYFDLVTASLLKIGKAELCLLALENIVTKLNIRAAAKQLTSFSEVVNKIDAYIYFNVFDKVFQDHVTNLINYTNSAIKGK